MKTAEVGALLATLVLTGCATPGATPAAAPLQVFEIPAPTLGTVVEYEGPGDLHLELLPASPSVRVDAEVLDLLVIAVDWEGRQTHLFVDPETFTLDHATDACPLETGGRCADLFALDWGVAGWPALLGAAGLFGRPIRVGENFSACTPCERDVTYTILPRDPTVVGSDFAVEIRSETPSPGGWLVPRGLIHMKQASPYPLRLQAGDVAYDLARITPGDGPAWIREPASTRSSTPAAPFSDGLPPEGQPPEGRPTFQEARTAAAGPDAMAGPLLAIEYSAGAAGPIPDGTPEHTFRVEFAHGNTLVLREYRGVRLGPQLHWEQEDRNTGAAPALAPLCADRSVPLWDLARRATQTGLLDDVEGWRLGSRDCASFDFFAHAAGGPEAPAITLHAETGRLRSARATHLT